MKEQSKVAPTPDLPSYMSETQQDYGLGQVKSPSELKIGQRYILHYLPFVGIDDNGKLIKGDQERQEEFMIIEEPNIDKDGKDGLVKVQFTYANGKTLDTNYHLSALGIFPFTDKKWPKYIWLEDPEKREDPATT